MVNFREVNCSCVEFDSVMYHLVLYYRVFKKNYSKTCVINAVLTSLQILHFKVLLSHSLISSQWPDSITLDWGLLASSLGLLINWNNLFSRGRCVFPKTFILFPGEISEPLLSVWPCVFTLSPKGTRSLSPLPISAEAYIALSCF